MKKLAILAILALSACTIQTATVTNKPGVVVSGQTQTQVTPAKANNVVLFAEDSANLTATAKTQLDVIAALLNKTGQQIRIVGHADETGSREYNLALGAQRAAAVRDYLVGKGVANTRISISTLGNESKAQSCDSAACVAQNRRVVIFAQ